MAVGRRNSHPEADHFVIAHDDVLRFWWERLGIALREAEFSYCCPFLRTEACLASGSKMLSKVIPLVRRNRGNAIGLGRARRGSSPSAMLAVAGLFTTYDPQSGITEPRREFRDGSSDHVRTLDMAIST